MYRLDKKRGNKTFPQTPPNINIVAHGVVSDNVDDEYEDNKTEDKASYIDLGSILTCSLYYYKFQDDNYELKDTDWFKIRAGSHSTAQFVFTEPTFGASKTKGDFNFMRPKGVNTVAAPLNATVSPNKEENQLDHQGDGEKYMTFSIVPDTYTSPASGETRPFYLSVSAGGSTIMYTIKYASTESHI
jgi:hypothetical protein